MSYFLEKEFPNLAGSGDGNPRGSRANANALDLGMRDYVDEPVKQGFLNLMFTIRNANESLELTRKLGAATWALENRMQFLLKLKDEPGVEKKVRNLLLEIGKSGYQFTGTIGHLDGTREYVDSKPRGYAARYYPAKEEPSDVN